MIELLDENFCAASYRHKDFFSVKIFSLLEAYGTGYSFVRFYAQKIQDCVTAVFSVLDSDITLSYIDAAADKKELCEFVKLIGFSTLLCDGAFKLDGQFESGIVMSSLKKRIYLIYLILLIMPMWILKAGM